MVVMFGQHNVRAASAALQLAETAMAARVTKACEDLLSAGTSPTA